MVGLPILMECSWQAICDRIYENVPYGKKFIFHFMVLSERAINYYSNKS